MSDVTPTYEELAHALAKGYTASCRNDTNCELVSQASQLLESVALPNWEWHLVRTRAALKFYTTAEHQGYTAWGLAEAAFKAGADWQASFPNATLLPTASTEGQHTAAQINQSCAVASEDFEDFCNNLWDGRHEEDPVLYVPKSVLKVIWRAAIAAERRARSRSKRR